MTGAWLPNRKPRARHHPLFRSTLESRRDGAFTTRVLWIPVRRAAPMTAYCGVAT